MQLHEVLYRPLVTEKSTALQAQGKYAFEVNARATKPEIKQAVEAGFKVKVTGVNVINMPDRVRHIRGRPLPPKPWKKAIVTLKPGDKIEIFEGV